MDKDPQIGKNKPKFPWNDSEQIYDWYAISSSGEIIPYSEVLKALDLIPDNSTIAPVVAVGRRLDLPINPQTGEYNFVARPKKSAEGADTGEPKADNKRLPISQVDDTFIKTETPAIVEPEAENTQITFEDIIKKDDSTSPVDETRSSETDSTIEVLPPDDAEFQAVKAAAISLATRIDSIISEISYYDGDAFAMRVRSKKAVYPDTSKMEEEERQKKAELKELINSNPQYFDQLMQDERINLAVRRLLR